MLATLTWVLSPLFLGFSFYFKKKNILALIDRLLMAFVYIILFIMGLNLAAIENLSSQITSILWQTAIYIIAILGCNLLFFIMLDRHMPLTVEQKGREDSSILSLFLNAIKLLGSIIFGLIVGIIFKHLFTIEPSLMEKIATNAGQIALMMLLFLVGTQLRSSGIKLKKVFLNRYGVALSLMLIFSSFLGGIIAAIVAGHDLITGLAISSGFGWYSLSASVLQKNFGPTIGSIAFFNDLFREFFAFAIIPALMKRFPLSAIGSGGATSLDFVLPIIQKSGGIHVVPIAISFGFIINIIAPVLLALFSSMAIN